MAGLNPVLNHWMQRLAPDVMLEHCERFQEGLEDVAKAALHQDIVKDRIVMARGLGLRNVVDAYTVLFKKKIDPF